MKVYCVNHKLVESWPNAECNYSHGSCWYPDLGWDREHRTLAAKLASWRSVWRIPALGADFRLDDDRVQLDSNPRGLDEANLIGSQCGYWGDTHMPIIDLDVPHTYVPSTTEGHGHLYIDVSMSWRKYERILRALADAEVLGWAEYVRAVDRRGTFVRKPGKPKRRHENERMEFRAFMKTFLRLWWRALRKELKSEREYRRARRA